MYINVGARPGCGVRIHGSVGQRCRAINEESPTLPVASSRSVSIGAMEEWSQKVQNANTHTLRRQSHEHAHSSRSVQGSSMGRWNVTRVVGSIRRKTHAALPQHTTPTVSTPVGRWNVTYGFDSRESSPPAATHIAKVSIPVGRWITVQGRFKMQTPTP